MTREKAILEQEPCDELDFVQPHKKMSVNLEICKMREATQEEREGVEQCIDGIAKPCDDAISRQAVLDEAFEVDTKEYDRIEVVGVDAIDALPPVNPQPKTGHWIIKDGKEQGYDIAGVKTWYIQITCDKCGFIKTAIEGHMGQYKYCPNCGCRMVEPQESEG